MRKACRRVDLVGLQVIEAREAMPRSGEKCVLESTREKEGLCQGKVEVIRDTRVKTDNADSSPIYSLLTKYTGYIFTMWPVEGRSPKSLLKC